MSLSDTSKTFNASAPAGTKPVRRASRKAKTKRPAPFSIRLSEEERAHLERKAGTRPLGAYIREKLLDGEETQPRKPSRAPTIDYAALAQVLGLLGKSQQIQCLFLLALAEEKNRLTMPEEECAALQAACADVRDMRVLLVKALGLKSGGCA
jgi:hypothetical protein